MRDNTEYPKRGAGPWGPGAEYVRRQRRSHHGRGRDRGWGDPAGISEMFGPMWGPGGGRSRRPRARRGDVRPAILDVLGNAGGPLNGYQVIQQIAERTDGLWKPSPGSIYPTIAQLIDEGLVEDAPTGRKSIRLTDAGRAHLEENAEAAAEVWAAFETGYADESADLRSVIKQTVGAIVQVATTGTAAQQDRAVEILAETRRSLYGLLAEGPEAAERDADSEQGDG